MEATKNRKVLVTGCAGFIGFHLSLRLMQMGHQIIGLDNLSPFYDEGLKAARLEILQKLPSFEFVRADLADLSAIVGVFKHFEIGPIVHLAAQAGVRHSLQDPHLYIESNVVGFVNLMEEARKRKVPHFVFASSSSVYGANQKTPFSESDRVDHPVSLYAATKKSNELMAHVYAHLYQMPVTGLRFFTVYGPWGRPDMAMFKFCKSILEGAPIEVYNHGNMQRDFTYVDDVVEGILRVLEKPPAGPGDGNRLREASPYYRIFNIGNHEPVNLERLIEILETTIGKKAERKAMPMQPGDVPVTYADIDELSREVDYRPRTSIETGVSKFVEWYLSHYHKTFSGQRISVAVHDAK